MLNKSEYSNGYDIRNAIGHGTNSQDERKTEVYYAELLKITALIAIKINEEFCLQYPQEE